MRTFNETYGKRNSIDAFDSFRAFTLSEMEMNHVRGGGNFNPNPNDPPIDPVDILIPLP
jgi:hypothetical protein